MIRNNSYAASAALKLLAPLALSATFAAGTGRALADVKLPTFFSDSMVLQRDKPLPVWGTADAGEEVTVTLGAATAKATADADGKWKVALPAQSAGTGLQLSVTGKNAIAIKDIAVGDVWICSGQSNMAFRLNGANKAQEEIAAANFPTLRSFTVGNHASLTPRDEVSGHWVAATPATAGDFTAVGYFFGKELNQKLNIPIGLIHTSWGGTPAQAWTSREALTAVPSLAGYMKPLEELKTAGVAAKLKYDTETLPAWQAAADKAKADGTPAPVKPKDPGDGSGPGTGANLFNGMINPLIPFAIKGAIWYQGESNAGNAVQYRTLFPTMITDWRTRWGQGDFPFLFVQLANYQAPQTQPVEGGGWPMLREAQAMTLSLPHTGMATAVDLGDPADPAAPTKPLGIHPRNKQDVGLRLAQVALATEYGQKVAYSGPVYDSLKIDGAKARVHFMFTEGGLKAKTDPLQGFAIAGEDKVWHWATGTVAGDDIVLTSPDVPAPLAVRYDWAINPIGNLVNGSGLPALPFRTDVNAAN